MNSKRFFLDFSPAAPPTATVAIVGVGNIGSHLVEHAARHPGVGWLKLVDGDRYEGANVRSQAMEPSEIGQYKAVAQAIRARRIRPGLRVTAMPKRLQDYSPGQIKADVVVAAVDSRAARQDLHEVCWRFGLPLIDTAVDAGGLLVRVHVHLPGTDAACLECGWTEQDYRAVDRRLACGSGAAPTATNSPSSLGAVAAGIAAIELQKLLNGQFEHLAVGREILLDMRHHKHYITSHQRNAACRFDHAIWSMDNHAGNLSTVRLASLVAEVAGRGASDRGLSVSVLGKAFFRGKCAVCNRPAIGWIVSDTAARAIRCRACLAPVGALAFDWRDAIVFEKLSETERNGSLAALGLRVGDVVTVAAAPETRRICLIGAEKNVGSRAAKLGLA